jgi:hypothetical protein
MYGAMPSLFASAKRTANGSLGFYTDAAEDGDLMMPMDAMPP